MSTMMTYQKSMHIILIPARDEKTTEKHIRLKESIKLILLSISFIFVEEEI